MKKPNFGLFTLLTLSCGIFSLSYGFSDDFQINIPNNYFNQNINIQNRSDVFFEKSGNYGFGMTFLGEPITNETTLTIGSDTITCERQLRGYYATYYGSFRLFPLDSDSNIVHITPPFNITTLTGGLFIDCYNGNTIYTGVYGHIKWPVWNLEIRAGLNNNHNGFTTNSPLKIIFGGGQSLALSGKARDSLGKESRFVVNIGLSQPECTPSTCFNGSNIAVSCSSDFEIRYTTSGTPDCTTSQIWTNKSYSSDTNLYVIACSGGISSSVKSYQYIKDNKFPAIPAIQSEPEFTQGLSNTINSNTATDDGCSLGSNVLQYQFCKSTSDGLSDCSNASNQSNWSTNAEATFNNLIDGQKYYYSVRSKDIAGNTSSWSLRTYSTQDNTNPAISFDKQSGSAALQHTVTITASDHTSKLVSNQTIKYKWQTNASCSETASEYTAVTQTNTQGAESISSSVTTPEADGEYYLCVLGGTVSDNAGNTNTTTRTSGKFIVQHTPAAVSATNSDSEQWKSGNIQITMYASAPTTINYSNYSWTGATHCINSGTPFTNGSIITKSSEGIQTLYLCIKDNYGQTGARTGLYKLDKTKPTGHFTNLPTVCVLKDTTTGFSITGYDSMSGLPENYISRDNGTTWTNETRHIATGGDTVTAIIRDNAGNTTGITTTIEACPDDSNFNFHFSEPNCTGGSVTVTITGDFSHVLQYQRGEEYSRGYSNSKTFSKNRSGQVKIKLDNGTIFSGPHLYLNVDNIDTDGPTVTIIKPEFVNECEEGVVKFQVNDLGCGSGKIEAYITDGSSNVEMTLNGAGEVSFQNTYDYVIGNIDISYTFTDSVGNTINGSTGLSIRDVPITARNFKRELTQIGNNYITSGNWKELSNAHAGSCENVTAEEGICVPSETSFNIIPNNRFNISINQDYLPENNTINCSFKLSDGDGSIYITGTFKHCTGDVDCSPELHPVFISGDKYTYYQNKINPDFQKYTSGYENLTIDIDGDGFSDITKYRYGCIQGEFYCTTLTGWKPCESEDTSGFCGDLFQFFEINDLSPDGIQICKTTKDSRTKKAKQTGDWTDYNRFFTTSISGDICSWSETIPYQSKNLGQRQIWIQVMDEKGRISKKVPTDIINYANTGPSLTLASDNPMSKNRFASTTEAQGNINSERFTIKLSANGANLLNGLNGYNNSYARSLSNYPKLKELAVLNFDIVDNIENIYRWLLSVYSGTVVH